MTYVRYELTLTAADFAKGTWSLIVTTQGFAPVTIPLTLGTTFRVRDDLPTAFILQFTDATGLVNRPSNPVTVPPVPQTPQPVLRFVGFEDGPDPPGPLKFAAVSTVDDPSLPRVA